MPCRAPFAGDELLPSEEEAGAHHVERLAAFLDSDKVARNVDFLHEAIVQDDAVEAPTRVVGLNPLLRRNMRHGPHLDREDDHPLVQHLIVFQVMEQRCGHDIR